ncbi:GDP-L-fucose synthase [Cognatiyoonia sp. IB215182]|uniref:GDP-L-fucose synthase family protein n=1 Tax=Cognatiyoonia sp. IB215182 TaxID=3097353 RepID=UPI002A108BC3|nr:GDP-L-fucose synthase [Cognatiyoonia sp. IB215182]MDX8354575.1 GDP-L-fucose synthase [Cognatiyoonia sp. IB215182]
MRIYLAGHTGMVGSAILRQLIAEGAHDVITAIRSQLDLTDQAAVRTFMRHERPDAVILAAAKVGGIIANKTYPATFIAENLMIATNVIVAAQAAGVEKLLQLGSSCIYPRDAPQPITEDALLTGALEPTNEPYAIAKIAAIKLCESYNRQYGTDYRSIMPTNLYGPGDNFHPENAHVLPALLARFHAAAQQGNDHVTIWGTGTPRREFLHVDDMAAAALHVMNLRRSDYLRHTRPMQSHLNVGRGKDIAIGELAGLIAEVTGFGREIRFDPSKPDGTPRKLLDVSKMHALGWEPKIDLRAGITATYDWYIGRCDLGSTLRAS